VKFFVDSAGLACYSYEDKEKLYGGHIIERVI